MQSRCAGASLNPAAMHGTKECTSPDLIPNRDSLITRTHWNQQNHLLQIEPAEQFGSTRNSQAGGQPKDQFGKPRDGQFADQEAARPKDQRSNPQISFAGSKAEPSLATLAICSVQVSWAITSKWVCPRKTPGRQLKPSGRTAPRSIGNTRSSNASMIRISSTHLIPFRLANCN